MASGLKRRPRRRSIFVCAWECLRPQSERIDRPSAGVEPPGAGPRRMPHDVLPRTRASPTMPLRPTSLVRAGVRRSASLRARCDRAATTLAGCALGRSAPRAKGSTGARSRRAATPGCQATLVALRSLWGGLAMVPRSSLGGRRPWWRSAAPGDAIFVRRLFRALPPLGFGLDLLPEVRLGRILKDF